MDDTCDTCKAEYEYKPANTVVVVYLDYPKANHLAAKCPKGHLERIYATADSLQKLTAAPGFVVRIFASVPMEIRDAADAAWYAATAPLRALNDEPPHWMVRELYDQIREFEEAPPTQEAP